MSRGVAALAATALFVVAALVAAACDRVVNLTPFLDGGPDPDGMHADAVGDVGGGLDVAPDPDARGLDAGAAGDAKPIADSGPAPDAARLDSGLDGGP